jgi:hypothetical protein
MEKSFHMAFSKMQKDVHQHMHSSNNVLSGVSESELRDCMISMMDAAEVNGIDLARSVLNKLSSAKRAARGRRASVYRGSNL